MVCHRYVRARTGLPADAVGIVGDPAHAATGGYHMGNDDLARVGRLSSDYSKDESDRDRPGSNAASALDIGDFRLSDGRTQRHLAEFEVTACRRGDARARGIREIIYTPVGGSTVRRYDRLGIRSTGDKSHLTHGHRSFFRDTEGWRARVDNYLGLLIEFFEGPSIQGLAANGMQMLVKGPTDTATWLVDGMFRRELTPGEVVGQQQIHSTTLLGPLGNGGQVWTGSDAKYWGVDVATLRVALPGTGVPLTAQETEDAAFRAVQRAEDS